MNRKFSLAIFFSSVIICLFLLAYQSHDPAKAENNKSPVDCSDPDAKNMQIHQTVLDTNNKTAIIQPQPLYLLSGKTVLLIVVDSIDNPTRISFAVDVFALSPKQQTGLLGHFTAYPPDRGSRNTFPLQSVLDKWNLKSANDLKIKLVLKPQSKKARLKLFISEIKWQTL